MQPDEANLTIAADTMRGGVVSADTNATITATLQGTKVIFTLSCVTPTNEVGVATATAEGVWTGPGQGFTIGTKTPVYDCTNLGKVISYNPTACTTLPAAINYSYGVDDQVPNVVNMTKANAVAALLAHHCTANATDVCGSGGSVQ